MWSATDGGRPSQPQRAENSNLSETTLNAPPPPLVEKADCNSRSLVPRGTLSLPMVVDQAMAKETETAKRGKQYLVTSRHHRGHAGNHESDSGLGSSFVSSNKASAITRFVVENSPSLSIRAINKIREHILQPLLAEPSLKDFEPILADIPSRIQEKEVICLRDLERSLILRAPERSKSSALYLDFCLTTSGCVRATVDYLSDGEKTRHGDLPYTNGYFIDFVDQVKHYASHLAIAHESGADEAKLIGGLVENGQPAELVTVKKDGTTISIATGKPVGLDRDVDENSVERKQSMTQELEVGDEMQIVMARRKNNARQGEYAPHKCREPGCDRGFRRPVDLTKHEKTHTHPWECPVSTCKYSEYGWPTEGELDRHVDPKHLAVPPFYQCLYKPCPYKSTRESRYKKHMEMGHGWIDVQTKATGKRMHDKTDGIPVYVSDDEARDIFKQPPPMADPDSLPLKQEHTPSTSTSYSTSQDFPHFTPGHIPPHLVDNSDWLADANEN
ncbi:hypothetical protein QBC33DRAFT_561013 [Phialemonium atrogriseum]|uniref:C2H2-type domain-containing protein n=1 Tax=Phialemonium atrogriseum TaxID=1093897 RepID=A0AAJ0FE29_9PEZI|nr:uncharacterized protein QBC33DRAFT_561013 [Phialemonium atrogriseum]KAK1765191.1 hypothetical protein QBC33DRAFT_561013 [Phialemonium atrogriseum]